MNEQQQSTGKSAKSDEGITLAQLELFIRLGNMTELDPNNHFTGILNLGNALIQGDMASLQKALAYYVNRGELISEHVNYLRSAFAHAEVALMEPAVLKYEGALGQTKVAIMLGIALERANKVAYISSDNALPSYVQGLAVNMRGALVMEPLNEDPGLLLKQISRIIRLPEMSGPPPFSTTAPALAL